MSFSGTYTALITPFRNGEIDVPAFKSLIDRQVAAGITGIVPVGTTGESPTLDTDEHIEVIRLAVEFAAGRCEVLAGTGANSTAEAIELTEAAEELGALRLHLPRRRAAARPLRLCLHELARRVPHEQPAGG